MPTQAPAKRVTPPKFNQKFNQESTIKNSEAENFICFSTIWEEGPTDLADCLLVEEDNSLDNEETLSERDAWNKSNFEELGEISDEEDTWSKTERAEFKFETNNEVNYKGPGERTIFKGISSISIETALTFLSMATVYSSRTCLPKFICSILVVRLLTACVLITGAYPHTDLSNQDLHNYNNRTNSSTKENSLIQTGNETIAATRLEAIQASNEALHAHLEQALARIEQNLQKNKGLAERIARSPRAIKTI